MSQYRAGVDVGGTKTHAMVFTTDSTPVADAVAPSPRGAEAVTDTIVEVVERACAQAGISPSALTTIGVGIPGPVDVDGGVVRIAVNLGVAEHPLAEALSTRLGVPVALENDVKAAALGAAAVLGRDELGYLNIGTGVAAAVIAGGRLVRGQGNVAGEIGHLVVDPAGPPCNCGQRGCIEALCGGGQVGRRLAAIGVALPDLVAAAASDPRARAELDAVAGGIATAVQLLVLSNGCGLVVLNGGVIQHCPGLVDAVSAELAARSATSDFLTGLHLAGRVLALDPSPALAPLGASMAAAAQPPEASDSASLMSAVPSSVDSSQP